MPRSQPQASYTCLAPNEGDDSDEPLCGKPSVGDSLCSTHLRRLQRNGTLERIRAPNGKAKQQKKQPSPEPCSVKGCKDDAWAAGLCGMHYNRVRAHGDPGPAETIRNVVWRDDATCRHPGDCPRPNNGGDGWCRMHAQRLRLYGDPGPVGQVVVRPNVWGQTDLEGAVWVARDSDNASGASSAHG